MEKRQRKSVAKDISTMMIRGKIPRGKPTLRYMNRGWRDVENTSSNQRSNRTEKDGGMQSWRSTRDTGIGSLKVSRSHVDDLHESVLNT